MSGNLYQTLTNNSTCEYYYLQPGTITFSRGGQNNGTWTTLILTETVVYFTNCVSSAIPPQLEEILAYTLSYTRLIPFKGSLVPFLGALSSSLAAHWILIFIVALFSWHRPFPQKFQVTFLLCYCTYEYTNLLKTLKQQHLKGYESIDPWLNELFDTPKAIPLYVGFVLCLISEGYILNCLYESPRTRILILICTTLLALVETALWIYRVVQGGTAEFLSGRLTGSSRAWMTIVAISQIIFFIGVLWTFRKRERLALARENWGVALVSLVGCTLSVLTSLLAITIDYTWPYALQVALMVRSATGVTLWSWNESIQKQENHKIKTGVLGRPMYDAQRQHHEGPSDQDQGWRDSSVTWTDWGFKVLYWLRAPHAPSLNRVKFIDRTFMRGSKPGNADDDQDSDDEEDNQSTFDANGTFPVTNRNPHAIHHNSVSRVVGPAMSMGISTTDSSNAPQEFSLRISMDLGSSCAEENNTARDIPEPPQQAEINSDPVPSGSCVVEEPPSFECQPGFRRQDYFDEKAASRHR